MTFYYSLTSSAGFGLVAPAVGCFLAKVNFFLGSAVSFSLDMYSFKLSREF